MNHQELLWNVHCVATVVPETQLNFKSAVIRSNRSSCLQQGISVKDSGVLLLNLKVILIMAKITQIMMTGLL